MSTEPQPVQAATAKVQSFFDAVIVWMLGSLFVNYLAQGTVYQEGFAGLLILIFALLYLIDWSRPAQLAKAQKRSGRSLKPRDLLIINALTSLWGTFGKAGFFVVVLSGGFNRMFEENRRVYHESLQAAHPVLFWTVMAIAVAWVTLGVWAKVKNFQAVTASNTPEEPKTETAPVTRDERKEHTTL